MDTEPAAYGRADKRAAILNGAMEVFAEHGYTRASIGDIADRAGVSTRTIYNHFHDKAALFHVVLEVSTNRIGETQVSIIDRHFHKITDLEADLNAFGQELTVSLSKFSAHFALMTQLNAETAHIPAEALESWRQAGPRRVAGALTERMRQLGERGLIQVEDPEVTASHLLNLIWGTVPARYSLDPPTEAEITATVAAGVRVFLYGYVDAPR